MKATLLWAVLWTLGPAWVRAAEGEPQSRTVKKEHEVVKANTLWDLSVHYYKDPWKWPVIYEANKDRIKDPHWIYPGQVFVIPGLDITVMVAAKTAPDEAGEAVARPEPAAAPAPASEPEPEPAPAPEPVRFVADRAPEAVPLPDALSTEIPKGMTGQQPALYRLEMPSEWTPDGKVVEFKGREAIVAAGDVVSVRLEAEGVRKGWRYLVYRYGGPTEADADKSALFVQKIGLLEVLKRDGDKEYRARILTSGDAVQVGDVLKREE